MHSLISVQTLQQISTQKFPQDIRAGNLWGLVTYNPEQLKDQSPFNTLPLVDVRNAPVSNTTQNKSGISYMHSGGLNS